MALEPSAETRGHPLRRAPDRGAPRTRCWRSWGGSHASTLVPCDLCDQVAVFHWRMTYPDLMLCAECLESYPEAQTADGLTVTLEAATERRRRG